MTVFFSILSFMIVYFWLNPDSAGKWLRKARKSYDDLNNENHGGQQ